MAIAKDTCAGINTGMGRHNRRLLRVLITDIDKQKGTRLRCRRVAYGRALRRSFQGVELADTLRGLKYLKSLRRFRCQLIREMK